MRRRCSKRVRRIAMVTATGSNHRWSMNFVHDQLASACHMLNIVGDFTREYLAVEIDTSLTGPQVARTLGKFTFVDLTAQQ
jgi:putative transposase